MFVWRLEGRLSELLCVVLCTEVAHSRKHTWMSSSYSSLDWILSHWAHFTLRRFISLYLCEFGVFVSYCIVLLLCCVVGWT